MNVVLLFSGVFLALLSTAIFTYFSFDLWIKRKNSKSLLEDQLIRFKQDITPLTSAVKILDQLTSRYFLTLNENGYQEICKIHEGLSFSAEHCAFLLKNGDNHNAKQLLRHLYVQRGKGFVPPCLWKAMGERASYTSNWGERTKKLLSDITSILEKNSSDLKEICGNLSRARKGTILMINEARLALVNM